MSTPTPIFARDEFSLCIELKHQAETLETTCGLAVKETRGYQVLLDVDETLAMSNTLYRVHDGGYRYNQPLIHALRQMNLSEIYLFTVYKLSSINKSPEDELTGSLSRIKLIGYLEPQGIRVKGVLTLLDPLYNRGPGAYYIEQVNDNEDPLFTYRVRPQKVLILYTQN